MKRKILILFLVILVGSIAYFFLAPEKEYPPSTVFTLSVWGRSMEPTYSSGEILLYSTTQTPKVGDVVFFKCHQEKCLSIDEGKTIKSSGTIKRISAINGNCYTLLGDNPEHSTDSRYYGPLCGDEIEIQGIIIGK